MAHYGYNKILNIDKICRHSGLLKKYKCGDYAYANLYDKCIVGEDMFFVYPFEEELFMQRMENWEDFATKYDFIRRVIPLDKSIIVHHNTRYPIVDYFTTNFKFFDTKSKAILPKYEIEGRYQSFDSFEEAKKFLISKLQSFIKNTENKKKLYIKRGYSHKVCDEVILRYNFVINIYKDIKEEELFNY